MSSSSKVLLVNSDRDLSEALIADLKIEITVKSEDEQEQLFEELSKRGYKCRVLTL